MNPAAALAADPRDELASLVQQSGFLFGPRAKGVDLGLLETAKKLAKKGASYEDTNYETGWWQHPVDKGWKTEKPEGQFIVKPLQEVQKPRWLPFDTHVDAPDLTTAYPGLRGITTDMKLSNNKDELGGFYDADKSGGRALMMRGPMLQNTWPAPSELNIRDVASHEIGHAIQHIEGWGAGSNPDMVLEKLRKGDQSVLRPYVQRDLPAAMQHMGLTGDPRDILKKNDDVARELQARGIFHQYQRSSGEEEANNIMRRLGMSADEIRDKPWWMTMERPFSDQVLTPAPFKLPRNVGGW